jgi:hypothetical protein
MHVPASKQWQHQLKLQQQWQHQQLQYQSAQISHQLATAAAAAAAVTHNPPIHNMGIPAELSTTEDPFFTMMTAPGGVMGRSILAAATQPSPVPTQHQSLRNMIFNSNFHPLEAKDILPSVPISSAAQIAGHIDVDILAALSPNLVSVADVDMSILPVVETSSGPVASAAENAVMSVERLRGAGPTVEEEAAIISAEAGGGSAEKVMSIPSTEVEAGCNRSSSTAAATTATSKRIAANSNGNGLPRKRRRPNSADRSSSCQNENKLSVATGAVVEVMEREKVVMAPVSLVFPNGMKQGAAIYYGNHCHCCSSYIYVTLASWGGGSQLF